MIGSMCKSWFIESSYQQKSAKGVAFKIFSVEHVTEFVQVVLQEVRLNTMVSVKDLPFCIADSDMYLRKH